MNNRPWIAIDLDGTVANCDHRLKYILNMETGEKLPRGQRNYAKFFADCIADTPIESVINYLHRAFPRDIFEWVYITGRPESMRAESVEWLVTHIETEGPNFSLYMRQEGDTRVDGVTKSELMQGAVMDRDQYRSIADSMPTACFDDRKSVIDAWRAMGNNVIDSKTLY